MRYQDATNLFAGLSRYSLKPEKSPLENFCTELLAWCLQNSDGFQKKFLKLMGLDFLENFKGRLEIETQQYWIKNDDDDEQEEGGVAEPEVRQRGFFDLIIQAPPNSNGKRDFLIALESKIGADFERGQLPDYRAELARIKKMTDYTDCCLVTLTKLSKKPPHADAHIRWLQVQDLLSKIRVEDSKLEIIYRQFADFLKEKGIAPLKIDKVNPDILKWGRCFNLQIDLWRILDRLRAGEELKSLMKQSIVFEPAKNESKLSLGIYGKREPLDWMGFEFFDISGSAKLCMVVSGKFRGEIRREKLKLLLGKTETLAKTFEKHGLEPDYVKNLNATWLNFRQPIVPEYDGDAEKIYEWLLYGTEEISKLKPN